MDNKELVERLRESTFDWDGSLMPDGAEPRYTMNCGEIRKAADAIQSLTADLARVTAERDERDARIEVLEDALGPFAPTEFGSPLVDSEGWTEMGIMWSRERISTWFGPSDFCRAQAALGGNNAE